MEIYLSLNKSLSVPQKLSDFANLFIHNLASPACF